MVVPNAWNVAVANLDSPRGGGVNMEKGGNIVGGTDAEPALLLWSEGGAL